MVDVNSDFYVDRSSYCQDNPDSVIPTSREIRFHCSLTGTRLILQNCVLWKDQLPQYFCLLLICYVGCLIIICNSNNSHTLIYYTHCKHMATWLIIVCLKLYSKGAYTKCAIRSSLNLKNKNQNKDKNDWFAKISPACRHVEFLSKVSVRTRKNKILKTLIGIQAQRAP